MVGGGRRAVEGGGGRGATLEMVAYLQSARCGGPTRTSPMVALARRRVRAPSARKWKTTLGRCLCVSSARPASQQADR